MATVIIGIDPHKATHTASAVNTTTHAVLATLRVEASLAGYGRLERWARSFPDRTWAVGVTP